jgi:hypothetical protein
MISLHVQKKQLWLLDDRFLSDHHQLWHHSELENQMLHIDSLELAHKLHAFNKIQ